ncbi:MAG: hypothetical protein EOP88_01910 [Verrucomicrobiaceae bacterium]|nr:MAG: hypothetical protein EOP88_01910 [Verrucomicrobiaceae bacterium]
MTKTCQFSRALPLVSATFIAVVSFATLVATDRIEGSFDRYAIMAALVALAASKCWMIFKR